MIANRPLSGSGLLLLLCNLEPQWHEEFRAWLSEDMFPARLAIGFKACASYDRIDAGSKPGTARFLTLYDVGSVGELYAAPYQRLRAHRDDRDAAFHSRFRDLYRATLTWVGPELAAAREAPAPDGFAPLLGLTRFALPERDIARFNAWYTDAHLPQCATVPGVVRVRRYLCMEAVPGDRYVHSVLHEFADESAAASWEDLCGAAGWTTAGREPSGSGCYRRVIAAAQAR